jgi:exonuclease I
MQVPVHFYDAITVGKNSSEGQVAQFHSALFTDGQPAQCMATAVRLRDDLWIDSESFDSHDLFDSSLDDGPDEYTWTRDVQRLFTLPRCLHIGLGSSAGHDLYIRNALYRNLAEYPNTGHPRDSHFLDLATLIRAVKTLRPEILPWDMGPVLGTDQQIRRRLMWDSGLAPENRAFTIRSLLSELRQASPSLVDHALTQTSVTQLKDALGFEDGAISSVRSIKACFLCHQTIMTERRAGMFMPVAVDLNHPDIVYMADLESDLSGLCDTACTAFEALVRQSPGQTHLPIVRVSLSRIPFIAALSAVRREDAVRLGISISVVKANLERLQTNPSVVSSLLEHPIMSDTGLPADVDHRMLAGDYTEADRRLLTQLHQAQLFDWPGLLAGASDNRLHELGKRMLLRYAPGLMTEQELASWKLRVINRVAGGSSTPEQVEMRVRHAQSCAIAMPTARGICDLSTRIQRLLGSTESAYI